MKVFLLLSLSLLFFNSFPAPYTNEEIKQIKAEQFVNSAAKVVKKKNRPACSDGKDNDRDGKKDFPRDPGCSSKRDNNERNKNTPVKTPTATPNPNPNPTNTPGGSNCQIGENVSLCGRRAFPDDNAWNQDISNAPVDPNSQAILSTIGLTRGLHPDFGTFYDGAPIGIPYVVVPGNQPKVPITSFLYEDESDPGPYPVPLDAPIEGGNNSDGDRHILVIDKDNWKLYELYRAFRQGSGFSADSGAIFDLNSNALRPDGWTSADAAGLPIFPGLVRYDEVMEQGEIKHALRFTVSRSRRAYVSPARHYASSSTDPTLPPMGMRVRLKASFDITPYPASVQVILRALKKYGMIVADNGSNWFITGAHDSRWNDDELSYISRVKGSDFEVILMTDITE